MPWPAFAQTATTTTKTMCGGNSHAFTLWCTLLCGARWLLLSWDARSPTILTVCTRAAAVQVWALPIIYRCFPCFLGPYYAKLPLIMYICDSKLPVPYAYQPTESSAYAVMLLVSTRERFACFPVESFTSGSLTSAGSSLEAATVSSTMDVALSSASSSSSSGGLFDGLSHLTDSGEFWMLLAAQSMAVGTIMVR